jgi:uncharacterized RDD family membrane protein YckC
MPAKNVQDRMIGEYAGLRLRAAAFAFDYLIIAGYVVALTVIAFGAAMVGGLRLPANPVFSDLLTFVTLVLPVILYFTLQEGSPREATWGKRKMGLRVITATGASLSTGQAFVRSLVKFLPWQLAHTSLYHVPGWPFEIAQPPPWVTAGFVLVWVLVVINLAALMLTRTHRTLYDWLAGAFVVVVAREKVAS